MTPSPRILVLNPTCLDVLASQRAWMKSIGAPVVADEAFRQLTAGQFDAVAAGAHALILPAATRHLPTPDQMERHRSLQVLSIAASGYEWLDVTAATRCGIVVTNGLCREGTEVVADLTFGLMLAVARRISHYHQLLRAGRLERGMGSALWRKTLGIIGLGHIGKAVVRRAQGFDMNILAATRHPDLEFVRQYNVALVELDPLLRAADFVSLHIRLNQETQGMISAPKLALMKPTAYLINTARAQLVDESALSEALLAGRLAGSAMDDPPMDLNSPLLQLPNFVCTPHLGNRAQEGAQAVFRCAMENAVAVLQGRLPASVVNPEVYQGALRAPPVTLAESSVST